MENLEAKLVALEARVKALEDAVTAPVKEAVADPRKHGKEK